MREVVLLKTNETTAKMCWLLIFYNCIVVSSSLLPGKVMAAWKIYVSSVWRGTNKNKIWKKFENGWISKNNSKNGRNIHIFSCISGYKFHAWEWNKKQWIRGRNRFILPYIYLKCLDINSSILLIQLRILRRNILSLQCFQSKGYSGPCRSEDMPVWVSRDHMLWAHKRGMWVSLFLILLEWTGVSITPMLT